jgi:propanol-preferring alcohol dehydrogenase
MSGVAVPGTFQHYIVSFTRYVTPIPAGVDLAEAAPVLCEFRPHQLRWWRESWFFAPGAGVTVLNGLKACRLSLGDWVAVPGAGGGLGHLAVQYAIATGMRVVGIDTGAEKRKMVEGYGAVFIDFKEEKVCTYKILLTNRTLSLRWGVWAMAVVFMERLSPPHQKELTLLWVNTLS